MTAAQHAWLAYLYTFCSLLVICWPFAGRLLANDSCFKGMCSSESLSFWSCMHCTDVYIKNSAIIKMVTMILL